MTICFKHLNKKKERKEIIHTLTALLGGVQRLVRLDKQEAVDPTDRNNLMFVNLR